MYSLRLYLSFMFMFKVEKLLLLFLTIRILSTPDTFVSSSVVVFSPFMRLQIEPLWLSGRRAFDLPSNSPVSPRTQQASPGGPPPPRQLSTFPRGLSARHWRATVGGYGI